MSQNNNIILESPGLVSQNNTIMIGNTPAATSGTNQTDCYIGGIYGSTIGATNSIVIIDNQGKLGTVGGTPVVAGSSSFLAYQSGNVSSATGNGTIWPVGSLIGGATGTSTFTTVFNNGGGTIVPGNSTTAFSYAVPATGVYYFGIVLNAFNGASNEDNLTTINVITMTAGTQVFKFASYNNNGEPTEIDQIPGSTIVSLTNGQTVSFTYQVTYQSSSQTVSIIGGNTPIYSWIYGFRLS